ncbi:MAG TPA: hypothetical protein VN616_09955 [Puia sp.]|nr:hypothetical protein [Puia sp.]
MKFLLVYLIAIGLNFSSNAQPAFSDSIARARNQVTRAGMLTLGGWAVANITSGFIIAGQQSGITKYAWQMNAYWNFVNLGLAGMGYLRAMKESHQTFSLLGNYDAQNALEKIYIFNLGLDLAYIGGGLYLRECGLNSSHVRTAQQLQGYGISVIVQGGFLLLEDATMICMHKRNTARVRRRIRETGIR